MASNDNVIKGGLLNIQSVSNKTIQIREMIDESRLDFLIELRVNLELGKRAFINSAPRLDNILPQDIKDSCNINIFKE